MIVGMFDDGALPVLERMVQFTERRHRLLANNIANLSTPFFKPTDLDTESFQRELGRAIDARRRTRTPTSGPLPLESTRQMRFHEDGMEVRPQPTHDNILFHDQNNRSLERTMQHLAENTMAHNMAIETLRSRYGILQLAIRERVA